MFEYWDNLQVIKKIDPNVKYFKKRGRFLQDAIINILTQGIEDRHPKTDENGIRHALSANEIHEQIIQLDNKNIDSNIPITNLYRHLKKMSDNELIQVVAVIKNGQRFTSYYGKSAKILKKIDDERVPKTHNFSVSENFIQFIHNLNPDLEREKIQEVLKSTNVQRRDNSDKFKQWAEENIHAFQGVIIDPRPLFSIFNRLVHVNDQINNGIHQFIKLMKIDDL
ncbi:MAG: hypothetical protein ACXAD7_17855 [Candidatus Kariarchaeaceae archaeon]